MCSGSMPDKENIELTGEITEALPNALFRIRLESGQEVMGHLSGKMRIHYIRLVPGDTVTIEMTPYDLTKGRIIKRLDSK